MKKSIALLMAALLVCVFIATAFAENASVMPLSGDGYFSWSGTSTGWNKWSSNIYANGSTWYISWVSTNLNTVPAKVKIWNESGDPASHTFYYSSNSYSSHSYLPEVTSATRVHVSGGRSSAGTEQLHVTGVLVP